jgi:hypothetical protein
VINAFWCLALFCTFYWCLPFVKPFGRAISFACCAGHFYLTDVAAGIFPWYLPSLTLLSILLLGHIVQEILNFCAHRSTHLLRVAKSFSWLFIGTLLACSLLMTLGTGFQMRVQQNVIENGNRKLLGLWLKEHAASPKDTVFLECLGYIGFYSQLKMLDFPGLSSPEVVAARRKLHTNEFAPLIASLQPDWLVLRPSEIELIMDSMPLLLGTSYRLVKAFDVRDEIRSYSYIPGRPYLEHDQTFLVFHKSS